MSRASLFKDNYEDFYTDFVCGLYLYCRVKGYESLMKQLDLIPIPESQIKALLGIKYIIDKDVRSLKEFMHENFLLSPDEMLFLAEDKIWTTRFEKWMKLFRVILEEEDDQ